MFIDRDPGLSCRNCITLTTTRYCYTWHEHSMWYLCDIRKRKLLILCNTIPYILMCFILSFKVCGTAWWRHQMETFSALLGICAGNSPAPGVFPAQRPVTRSFDVFFDLRLNKWLRKQSWGWWFETLSRPSWRHCDGVYAIPLLRL